MIRRCTIDELFTLGDKFAESSKFVEYDRVALKVNWKKLMLSDAGVLFAYIKNNAVVGMICGIHHPNILTNELTATEMFWFVDPRHRGGVGTKLLDAFEDWAKSKGCSKVVMVSMADLMPEIVGRIYENKGYEKLETHYIKGI